MESHEVSVMRGGRRGFLKNCSILAATSMLSARETAGHPSRPTVVLDPKPLFDISPFLYMQFMEPLGTTDGSVEAAWDYETDDWREDLVATVKDLSPDVIRYGGIFSWYYKWREGVGPVEGRPATRNYAWGGKETNRVGTHEFVNFCRRVGAEPLYCVNFLSDGRRRFWKTTDGQNRSGDAREAADWVSYANDPENRDRKANGVSEPLSIKLWQIGNETSYGDDGFSKDEAILHTVEFAKAMKRRDSSIQLIGWGDRGAGDGGLFWAGDLLREAGEYLDYVAIHMMGQSPQRPDTVLKGWRYQQEPEQAWEELLGLSNRVDSRVREFKEVVSSQDRKVGIAVTEGHLSLRPYNANPILSAWLSAVYHARSMNVYQRHGDRVKISTAADFFGTRWTVNAVMIPVPGGTSYLMPVGSVMRLFKRYNGKQAVAVKSAPSDLDIAASRSENRLFLHVANVSYRRPAEVAFAVEGMTVAGGRIFEIAPESLQEHVDENRPDVFAPKEKPLAGSPPFNWRFPAGSVSAVELELKA